MSDARPVLAPEWSFNELADRLVETGIPWNSPAPMFATTGPRFLIDVDLVAVLGGERRASPAVCEKPIITNATAASATVPAWSHSSARPEPQRWQPAGHVADQRHTVLAQIEQPAASRPPTTSTSAPGPAARLASPKTTTSATRPTRTVVRFASSRVPNQDHNS